MRIKNSFAAAVAAAISAVVFSAAMQPVEAATITIDNFSNITGTTASSSGTVSVINLISSGTPTGTGSVFNQRFQTLSFQQTGGSGTRRAAIFTGTASSDGSTGTFSISKSATTSTSFPQLTMTTTIDWGNADFSIEDLSAGGNDAIQYRITAFTSSGTNTGITRLNQFSVSDDNGNNAIYDIGLLATGSFTIPFTSFVDQGSPVDWTRVNNFQFRSNWFVPTVGNTGAAINSVTFDYIQAVPEPTPLVSVAAVGAMFGAWRLRKLRRARPAASEAIAG